MGKFRPSPFVTQFLQCYGKKTAGFRNAQTAHRPADDIDDLFHHDIQIQAPLLHHDEGPAFIVLRFQNNIYRKNIYQYVFYSNDS